MKTDIIDGAIDNYIKSLQDAVLSLLTDNNIKFIQVEGEDERFGALIALGYAFKEVDRVFKLYRLKREVDNG